MQNRLGGLVSLLRVRLGRVCTLLSVAAVPLIGSPLHAQTFSDGDFGNKWTYGATGNAFVLRQVGPGNPGPRLAISSANYFSRGMAFNSEWTTTGKLAGTSFSFLVDFITGLDPTRQGQSLGLLVRQASAVYYTELGLTGSQYSWGTFARNGVFSSQAFTLISGSGPANPLLGGETQTTFGFAGRNVFSGQVLSYYDNVRLTINPTTVVPEPSSLLLVSGGVVMLAVFSRRRRA